MDPSKLKVFNRKNKHKHYCETPPRIDEYDIINK